MNVTAIVLAAGAARRMGAPKPFLFAGEQRVIDRVVHACAATQRVVVVLGTDAPPLAAAARLLVTHNATPELGPISSLKIALSAAGAQADWYLMFPVDYPLVEGEDVAALLQAAASTSADVVVPLCRGRRGHPILFRGRLAPDLQGVAAERTARDVLFRDPRAVLAVDTPREQVLIDMDTPFDYGRVDAIARRRELSERLRGDARLRIVLARKRGVLAQDVFPAVDDPDFTITRLKLEGGLGEEWQVAGASEFAAAIHVAAAASAFVIATSLSPRPLPVLSRALAALSCRELIAPSMAIEEPAASAQPWLAFPEVNGWRRQL